MGMVREAVWVPFREPGRPTLRLEARLVRPAAVGRYPLVLISHGSPRNRADAKTKTIDWADWIADDFARRGWIAATVLRRGYGHSEGTGSEGYGSCKQPHYAAAGLASPQDLLQTVSYLRSRSDVDPARVLLLGISAGGFASIAAASLHPAGLVGVVNFAGGRGSVSADNVCNPDDLVAAYGDYGRTVRVPSLWIYARNDHFFGPELAQRMFAAFRTSGAPGELIIAPPYKQDGHNLIFGQSIWRDDVYGFLKSNGLPSAAPNLRPPPGGSKVEQAFAQYLATPAYEKAFLIGRNGAYGWASGYATRPPRVREPLRDDLCARRRAGGRRLRTGRPTTIAPNDHAAGCRHTRARSDHADGRPPATASRPRPNHTLRSRAKQRFRATAAGYEFTMPSASWLLCHAMIGASR